MFFLNHVGVLYLSGPLVHQQPKPPLLNLWMSFQVSMPILLYFESTDIFRLQIELWNLLMQADFKSHVIYNLISKILTTLVILCPTVCFKLYGISLVLARPHSPIFAICHLIMPVITLLGLDIQHRGSEMQYRGLEIQYGGLEIHLVQVTALSECENFVLK